MLETFFIYQKTINAKLDNNERKGKQTDPKQDTKI